MCFAARKRPGISIWTVLVAYVDSKDSAQDPLFSEAQVFIWVFISLAFMSPGGTHASQDLHPNGQYKQSSPQGKGRPCWNEAEM